MPVILLGLGGLFVFVAVSLFLAVTWEVLPLAVKAALMLGFTAAVGGTAAHLSRKGLRGSAEALWALVAALLMLDLRAGYASGLFGLDQLSTRSVSHARGRAPGRRSAPASPSGPRGPGSDAAWRRSARWSPESSW